MASSQAHKNDIHASKLLFGALAIAWVEQLFIVGLQHRYSLPHPWGIAQFYWILLQTVLCSGIYYAIRRGSLWAKVVLLVFCMGYVYLTTSIRHHLFAGIPVTNFYLGMLPRVAQNMLVFWALVLMFKRYGSKQSSRD